jgi:putative Holliday junction resolvase
MRVIGVDFGARRLGLALSDPSGTLARPWRTMERRGPDADTATALAREIEALAAEDDGLAAVVLGLPARLDGRDNELTARVRQFAAALRARVSVPVVLQDERLTSREAEQRLAEREPDWRKRKQRIDAAAAAIILQDYLDAAAPAAASSLEPEP